jgi:hypothetical protein
MNLEFSQHVELEFKIKVSGYVKGRPAPACSDPSSPSYSDPGDDPEWRDNEFYLVTSEQEIKITDEKIIDYLENLLIDDIITEGEKE